RYARNTLGRPSGDGLNLSTEGQRGEAAVPPDAERGFRAVEGHDTAEDLDAVLSGPHHAGSQELRRVPRLGGIHDRLVAVLLELALTERGHRSGRLGLRHVRGANAPCAIRPPETLRVTGRRRISAGVRSP